MIQSHFIRRLCLVHAAALVLALAGCGGTAAQPAPTATLMPPTAVPIVTAAPAAATPLREVQTARAVDADLAPRDQTEVFTPQDTVYIAYEVAGVEAGDELFVRYTIDGVVQPPAPEDRDRFSSSGDFRGVFSISGPAEAGLPPGIYQAELFYNDQLTEVVVFRVRG